MDLTATLYVMSVANTYLKVLVWFYRVFPTPMTCALVWCASIQMHPVSTTAVQVRGHAGFKLASFPDLFLSPGRGEEGLGMRLG